MKKLISISSLVILLFLFCNICIAEVPHMINYQGKLTKATGVILDTTISMVFTIYTDSNGTTPLWTEIQSTVVVEKGVFNVLLGNVISIPDSVFDGSVRYLGVKVGEDPEITPRKLMVSVAYAYTDGDWTKDGDNIYRLQGNVGIGTMAPDVMLQVGNFQSNARVRVNTSDLAFSAHVRDPLDPTNMAQTMSTYLEKTTLLMDDCNQIWLGFRANEDGGGSPELRFGSAIQAIVEDPNNSTKKSGLKFLTTETGSNIGTERMRITGNGNVGIGTMSPSYKLDINGGGGGGGSVSALRVLANTQGGGTYEMAEFLHSNLSHGIGINYDQIFAIGTNPNNALTIKSKGSGNLVLDGGISGNVVLQSNSSGNVGIGTTSPQEKLDVEGNVQAYAFNVGDIFFQKDKEKLWRMYEDEEGLYIENLKTGKVYKFILQEVVKK